ncbi:Hypothetical protein PHPALM_9015 [Phytophthora palmivora]|uniref:Uncharacterized protein n=1 Tax=Phytophthora palmivora TaxID=4796 RepID=A0A2P4Y8E5_9STRA|nr:Hypothetical protein PHPALM_9015 [Phytophthora palmivora]
MVSKTRVKLHGAKNNKYGNREHRYHHKSGNDVLCAIRAARWIIKGARSFRTHKDGPAHYVQAEDKVSMQQKWPKRLKTRRLMKGVTLQDTRPTLL